MEEFDLEVRADVCSLKKLGQKLLADGPHKLEQTPRRVRALFGGAYIFDTIEPRHVWEHPYYPQFYVPYTSVKSGLLTKENPIDEEHSAYLATLKVNGKETDQVLGFDKGPLQGLVRFEFNALGLSFTSTMLAYLRKAN